MANIFYKIAEMAESGRAFVVVSVVEKKGSGPAEPGAKMIVDESGRVEGTVGGGALEFMALKEAKKRLASGGNGVIDYFFGEDEELFDAVSTGMACGGTAKLFYEVFEAGAVCYLFGGGHIGREIVYLLRRLPYRTVLCDNRPDVIGEVEGADEKITGNYDEILKRVEISGNAFCVVATHSHKTDFKVIRHLLKKEKKPKYLGLVASVSKNEELMSQFKEEKISLPDDSFYFSPVGLNIGGRAPAEIALAVVAEMQRVRYGVKGEVHLRDEKKLNGNADLKDSAD